MNTKLSVNITSIWSAQTDNIINSEHKYYFLPCRRAAGFRRRMRGRGKVRCRDPKTGDEIPQSITIISNDIKDNMPTPPPLIGTSGASVVPPALVKGEKAESVTMRCRLWASYLSWSSMASRWTADTVTVMSPVTLVSIWRGLAPRGPPDDIEGAPSIFENSKLFSMSRLAAKTGKRVASLRKYRPTGLLSTSL